MESLPRDPYERQLLEVFKSCDCDGEGVLDNEGLLKLCDLLHLEDGREELIACLFPNGLGSDRPSITFSKFRDALLTLLGGVGNEKRDVSPVREVSPKYVYGQKKYGRRTRPEATDIKNKESLESSVNGNESHMNKTSLPRTVPLGPLFDKSSDAEDLDLENPSCQDFPEDVGVETSEVTVIDKDSEGLGEAELRSAWKRLGVGTDGYLHRSELAMVCSAVGMDMLADQVVAQVFSSLKTDDEGRICFEEFLELFRSRTEECPQSPQFTQYSKPPNIMDLCDFPSFSNRRILQELQATRCELEAVTEERDKLRCDLADANRRSTLLAQEVDERHARIEKTAALTVELLEQKHTEEIKNLKKQIALEKEQLLSSNQKLEESLASHVEQLSKLIQDFTALQKDYENLEKENQTLNSKLKKRDQTQKELLEKLECMDSLHQRILELESASELVEKLTEKVGVLQTENTELRDKNDELTSQVELLISRNSKRREGSWSAFEYGGATKRRGKSPERFQDNRLGKVRRCCTETDLTLSSNTRLSQTKLNNSESGLEEDLSTLRASPTPSSDNDYDVWGSGSNLDEVERLRAYVAELEAKLDQQQMLDWTISKSIPPIKDEDSLNNFFTHTDSFQINESPKSIPDVVRSTSPATATTDLLAGRRSEEVGVQTVESHCHQVEAELELVRSKILALLQEKKACSQEVCALKLRLESFMCGIPEAHVSTSTDHTDSIPELPPLMDCIRCKSAQLVSGAQLDALKEENCRLLERCAELETSLELMRVEYEKTEDYWENKLDDERRLFDLDKEQSDEKFAELEAKIQEYAELLCADQGKKQSLPPIEEKDYLEKQFTDLEEEYESYRLSAEEVISSRDAEISELKDALAALRSFSPERKDAQVQTEPPRMAAKNSRPGTHKLQEICKKSDTCCTLCSGKVKARERLKAEVEALAHRKQILMGQNASLQAATSSHHLGSRFGGSSGSASSLGVFQSLSNRLRQQEIRCRELQSALRSQQKETEAILQKAWERHKIDLTTIQNSLRITQEKLQQQKKNTKQQLDCLAVADTLAKDLFAENAHLVQTVHSLSESALHNSL